MKKLGKEAIVINNVPVGRGLEIVKKLKLLKKRIINKKCELSKIAWVGANVADYAERDGINWALDYARDEVNKLIKELTGLNYEN